MKATVLDVHRETPDCVSIELDTAAGWRAGQYVEVTLPEVGVTRCYSISRLEPPLRIAVKRVTGGQASNWLNDHLVSGDSLEISEPTGMFTLRPGTAPVVLVAGGSGITPVLALLRQARADGRHVRLFYASTRREDEIYAAELDDLSADHGVEMVRHYDDEAGRPTAETLEAAVIPGADYYLCGPAPLIELGEARFAQSGRVFVERFVAQGAGDDPPLPTPEAVPGSFSLWLHGRCRTVTYTPGKTLLECAREAGLKPRSSCESGFCGSCLARVRDGGVLMRRTDALTAKDQDEGLALLCQSVPRDDGALEVDADNTSFRLSGGQGLSSAAARWSLAAAVAFMVLGTVILRLT